MSGVIKKKSLRGFHYTPAPHLPPVWGQIGGFHHRSLTLTLLILSWFLSSFTSSPFRTYTSIQTVAPRKKQFGSGRTYRASAKQKKRARGGMLTKGEAKDDHQLPPQLNSPEPTLIEEHRDSSSIHYANPCSVNDATLMESNNQIDDSRCYFCRRIETFTPLSVHFDEMDAIGG